MSSNCVVESGCESTGDGSRDVSRFTACYWAESCPAAVLRNQVVNQLVMEAVMSLGSQPATGLNCVQQLCCGIRL